MTGTLVNFPANAGSSSGYLAVAQTGMGPGILVLQEWWGLVDHIKDVCDRFAAAGFTALAPDLFNGEETKSPDEAAKLQMALNINETEKTLRGAVDYLAAHQGVSTSKVGVVGFCMGGQLALLVATTHEKVGATVDFYGIHPNVNPDFSRLSGPVLGLFAEYDKSVPEEKIVQLESAIEDAGKSCEMHIYPGAKHAFFNDNRPEVYNQEAAADAWQRTIQFLRTNLTPFVSDDKAEQQQLAPGA